MDLYATVLQQLGLDVPEETESADIEVSTRNQIVTLEGTVVSKEQEGKILQTVGDIVGVKEVRSQLTVERGTDR